MKLVIEDEGGTRSVVPFTGDAIVVGRGDGVSFRLGERNVSRRHARFVLQAGAVFVEDLGSRNGTRVNGERIGARRKLRDGDLVQIGDYDLAVLAERVVLDPAAPPPLPAPRPDPNAVTVRLPQVEVTATPVEVPAPTPVLLPAVEPTVPEVAVAAAPPAPRGRSRALAVIVALLAVAAAAGWALTRP